MSAEQNANMDPRFQTDNSVTARKQPKQQLSKAMEHMRFAVTIDPKPHTNVATDSPQAVSNSPDHSLEITDAQSSSSPPPESDAYGVPASIAPLRKPPHRSHSPTNNQKRTDPFAFGSRYLEEGDDIFEFNAWDHVDVDPSYLTFSEEQFTKQREAPVSDFDRKRFNDNPEKWWNLFYKNNKTNFFKNRKWLSQEFPVLDRVCEAGAGEATLLEVGAGAGNSAFPILQRSRNAELKVHACDFSKKAVELIRGHELYDSQCIQADVWDVAASPDSENGGLPPGLGEGSVDVVLMIFIFSALSPRQWDQAVRNVWRVLKTGGQVLFRDYGRGDLAQVRFRKGRYMEENFYVRGDGTRVYFFDEEELRKIWGGRALLDGKNGSIEDTDGVADKIDSLKLDGANGEEAGRKEEEAAETQGPRPAFEIVHFGVDRRMLVNRQRRLKMYRCWMQAVFRKPGHESEVPTSTIRQDKSSETDAGEATGETA